MNAIDINGTTYSTPSSWNELTRKQLIRYCRIILRNITMVKAKMIMVSLFVGFWGWRRLNGIYKSERKRITRLLMTNKIELDDYNYLVAQLDEQIYHLQNSVNFLFADIQLTRWLIPTIRCGWFGPVLCGPANEMRNSSFHEFGKADSHFLKYMKSKDTRELNQFIACLYRKPTGPSESSIKWNGDIREPFNEHTVSKRSELIKRISLPVKQAIITNYIGVRSNIVKKHPHVFVSDDSKKKEPDPNGLLRIIPHLGQIVQNDLIARSELYSVLYNMEQSEINRIKQEAEMEKIRKKS